MIFYLLYYLMIVTSVCLYAKYLSNEQWGNFRIIGVSFGVSALLLLAWNFVLGDLLLSNSEFDYGVSIVLRSVFSIALLFVYSMISYFVLSYYTKYLSKRGQSPF